MGFMAGGDTIISRIGSKKEYKLNKIKKINKREMP